MSETLTCPVCRNSVASTSSMCFSCHLPIRDVRESQQSVHRRRRTGALLLVLIGSLVLAGAIGWRLSVDAPTGDKDAPDGVIQTGQGVDHAGLEVVRSDGRFDGTIELTNHTTVHANVYVQVHVYDGEQEIGELSGDVSLKPRSTAVVDLQSFDDFRSFDDTVVEVLPIPAAVK